MARNERLANWDKIQKSAQAKRRADAEEAELVAASKKAEAAKAQLEYEAKHPVSSGKIPLVDYVPPKWDFK